jgi:hypothetical protein
MSCHRRIASALGAGQGLAEHSREDHQHGNSSHRKVLQESENDTDNHTVSVAGGARDFNPGY